MNGKPVQLKGEAFELYNLTEDPREERDLIEHFPKRANRMKKDLRKWQKSVIRSIEGKDY